MFDIITDALLDALLDTAKLLPFLFLTVFVMEYIEHKAKDRLVMKIHSAGKAGPVFGALCGIVPQCGFSAAIAELFNGGLVTAGTLAAVFISTSDEAVPILLSSPGSAGDVLKLVLVKLVIGIAAGMLLDIILNIVKKKKEYKNEIVPHICKSDGNIRNILKAAVLHTLEIVVFLFVFSFVIATVIGFIGEEKLAALLLPGVFQPLLAAVFGLIPNCAASVLLTRLYTDGMITFGSAVAGLCSSAGVGLLVLLRGNRRKKVVFTVVGFVFAVAVISGVILQTVS